MSIAESPSPAASPVASMGVIPLAQRSLGDIAASLPGATAVFRRHKLDFCCGGNVALAAAAAGKGLSADTIVAELDVLDPGLFAQPPREAAALIEHVLARYHTVHRRELPELVRLARRVEAVHRDHPDVPAGLAHALESMQSELGDHMDKEETILFPLMRQGGHPMIAHPVSRMRLEHDDHGERLRAIEALSRGAIPPPGACATWRALYTGVRKLADDLMEHIHLENNVLFPQFERAQASG
ncbi:MAG: iron-sulfur cluster repair protein YtfE [Nevskia sp.]|nr:iron-sulfur cluster repair protein YtfE [Nevskia sp.]